MFRFTRVDLRVILLGVGVIALVVTLVVVACNPIDRHSPSPIGPLVVGVDLAFHGSSKNTSDDTWRAMQLYLEQQGGRAGRYEVQLKPYDNSNEKGIWDPDICLRNARGHVSTTNEVAVMGTVNSGCAKVIAPVLNEATDGPMLMVSHANTNVGLTRPEEVGEPAKYFPSGKRSYARVVVTDDIQGAVAARYAANDLKVGKVFVLHDYETYGERIAKFFADEIKELGVEVVGTASWNKDQASYEALFGWVKATGADAVFLAGIYDNNGAQLVKDKVTVLGSNIEVRLIAPAGFSGDDKLKALGKPSEDAYLTIQALSTDHLKKAGGVPAKLIDDYKKTYGEEPRDWYPLYGVQALQVILAAIEKSDGTRRGVRDAVFEGSGVTISESRAILGKAIHIDPASGDVNAKDVTVLKIVNGSETFVKHFSVDR